MKMSKNSSAKYYQKIKKDFTIKVMRGTKTFQKKRKT